MLKRLVLGEQNFVEFAIIFSICDVSTTIQHILRFVGIFIINLTIKMWVILVIHMSKNLIICAYYISSTYITFIMVNSHMNFIFSKTISLREEFKE